MPARALPVAAALTATLAWGGMFPVLTVVLARLDPFQASAERYAFAAVLATLLGHPPVQLEIVGAAITVLALVGDNVVSASPARLSQLSPVQAT